MAPGEVSVGLKSLSEADGRRIDELFVLVTSDSKAKQNSP
jgi:hypothetical protein